jgi:hypothetical protein
MDAEHMTTAAVLRSLALRPGGLVAGRFRLIELIGEGGMGQVWAAEQQPLQRKVALKLLNVEASSRPDALARFELEARALSRLDDPHVVRVLDFGHDEQAGFFLATEFLQGHTLEALLTRHEKLSPEHIVHIMSDVLLGLEAAHAAGIVHRDLKPANIMLVERAGSPPVAKLLDFGIAKVFEQGGPVHLTEAGAVFGTPQYISPEQALCRPVDLRADLYACGVILFRALMGRLPFHGDEPGTLAMKHVTEPIPALPAEDVPPALAAIVRRAMSKDPRARDESARAMKTALLDAVSADPPSPLPLPPGATPMPSPPLVRTSLRLERAPVVRAILAVRFSSGLDSADGAATLRLAASGLPARPTAPTLRISVAIASSGAAGLARSVVEAFGGMAARISEDGLSAELVSPTDALLCAAAIQDRLVARGRSPAQVAVDAGEIQPGEELRGAAVDRAEALCRRAHGGEVLFTHAVYLSMARSEINCEKAADAQVGQPVYRLGPVGLVRRPELPFGGGTLDRARARSVDRALRRGGRAVVATVLFVSDTLGRVLGRAGRHVLAGMSARPIPAALLLLLLGAATALALRTTAHDPAVEVQKAMAEGRLELARALAERWTRDLPASGDAHAWLARVLAARGEVQPAATELQLALDRDPALAEFPEVVRVVAAALAGRASRTAQALALLHPTPAMMQVLHEAALGEDDVAAFTSIDTLRELGGSSQLFPELAARLEPVTDCAAARRAIERLAVLGEAGTLPLLQRVREGIGTQDGCELRKPVTRALKNLGAQ